jgi:hypothetical protein
MAVIVTTNQPTLRITVIQEINRRFWCLDDLLLRLQELAIRRYPELHELLHITSPYFLKKSFIIVLVCMLRSSNSFLRFRRFY